MGVKHLLTKICLPPGPLPEEKVRTFLRLAFEEYRWFEPARYELDQRLNPARLDYDLLVTRYQEKHSLLVLAPTDRDFFLLTTTRPGASPFIGNLSWETSASEARQPDWRVAHMQQVAALMRLFDAPLAQSGLAEDLDGKTQRLVPSPDGVGSVREFTVRDPSEGLAGLFWRNFFGPPFVRMFGDRLDAVPPTQRQDLEGGIVLVQPYELPAQAMTAEGMALEQRLIAQLGPECFYDPLRQVKPSRVPQLSPTPG